MHRAAHVARGASLPPRSAQAEQLLSWHANDLVYGDVAEPVGCSGG